MSKGEGTGGDLLLEKQLMRNGFLSECGTPDSRVEQLPESNLISSSQLHE
jgi:hypothetical protein